MDSSSVPNASETETTASPFTAEQWQILRDATKGEEGIRQVLALFGYSYTPQPEHRPKQILVIDDDPAIITYTKTVLNRNGFETFATSNPQAALSMLLLKSPDLVLLDIQMPGLDGGEVFAKLREMPHAAATPVIFMTGLIDPSEEAHLNKTSTDRKHYLGKPFTPEKLVEAVSRVLALV